MKPATSPLGVFERYLSVWVALAIAAGVGLGNLLPGLFGRDPWRNADITASVPEFTKRIFSTQGIS